MSTTTTKYGFMKPEKNDPADITATNENWDKLDEALTKHTHDLSMDGHRITDVAEPTSRSDVATRGFVEDFSLEGSTYVAVDEKKDGNIILRPYVADEDELTFYSHIDNKNNPHKVTIDQVGAFPKLKQLSSPLDLNDLKNEGFYFFPASVNAENSPVSNGFVIVMSTGTNVKQVLFRLGSSTNHYQTFVRTYINGSGWTSWKKFQTIETKVATGTTNTQGNVALGLNVGSAVPVAVTAKNSSDNTEYMTTFFAKGGAWWCHVVETDGTTIVKSTGVSITGYYMEL